jgi:hypothetical protein
MAELIVQHDKINVRDMAGTEIAIRAANVIGKATKKIETEAARCQAESQGGYYYCSSYHGPLPVMPLHPDSLPTLGALPALPNRAGTPLEEESRPCRPVLATPGPRGRVRRCPHPQQVPLSLAGRSVCCL